MQINEGCWCGIAQLVEEKPLVANDMTAETKHTNKTALTAQRIAVRTLCQQLLTQANRADELDDSQFPYRLKEHGDYLCFTHSHDYVAVLLNARRPCGIDLELSAVRWRTAQRFYHADELVALAALEPTFRQVVCRYLWQIKECIVKVEQGTLIPTLGRSLLPQLTELILILARYRTQTPYPMAIEAEVTLDETHCLQLTQPVHLDNGDYYIHLSPYLRLVSLC